jgi:hypothetical protein
MATAGISSREERQKYSEKEKEKKVGTSGN